MVRVLFSFVLVLLLISSVFGYPSSIRTNPPITINSFTCDCNLGSCSCRLGDIQLGVDLKKVPEIDCSAGCVAFFGEVMSVNLPFLKIEILEESQRKASLLFKIGLGTEVDKTMQVLKEKMIEASKSKSKKALIDLTTYFVYQITKDITFQKKPNAAGVALVVQELASLAKKGKLTDFLSFYFYLRAKHPELLLSSDIDESKKSPVSPLALYRYPQEVSYLMKLVFSDLKNKVEAFNNAIKAKNVQAYNQLLEKFYLLGVNGVYWGLDENFPDLMSRLAAYLPNYEKKLNNSKSLEQEVKSIVEDLNKKKKMKRQNF